MSNAVPTGWHVHELGDLAEKIEGGGTPTRDVPAYWSGNIPWVTVKDLKTVRLSLAEESISELGLKESSSRLIPKNTVIIATRMALGKAVVFDKDVTINQDLKAIFPKKNLGYEYLLHWYLSKSEYIQGMGTGSTVKGIRLEDLRLIPIKLPPLPEQQKIAAILTAVDEVIASTQAQISKLKDLKTAMMQELLTKGIGHTEFKDSAVGRIPKEWKISSLEQVTIAKGLQTGPFGSQLHAHEYVDFGIPVVMPKDMQDQNIVTSTIAKITQVKADELNRHKLQTGDILFSRRGDIGRCVIVKVENQGWICGTGCLKARLNDGLVPEYFIYYLTLTSVVEWLNNNAVGQTMLNLNTSILAELPVILPPLKEQHIIADSMKALINTLDAKESKLRQLNNTKKALMQDLLTGKVRVKVN